MKDWSHELRKLYLFCNVNDGAEKIVFGTGEPGIHYTIRFWSKKKSLDLHSKNEKTKEYKTLFEIKYFTLFRILSKMVAKQKQLFEKYWWSVPVNTGKLGHHNCILFAQSSDESDFGEIAQFKAGRFKFRKKIDLTSLNKLYLLPNQIDKSEHEIFQILKFRKGKLVRNGTLLSPKNIKPKKYLVSNRAFRNFNRELGVSLLALMENHDFVNKAEVVKVFKEKLGK